jgi:hypothetical protein
MLSEEMKAVELRNILNNDGPCLRKKKLTQNVVVENWLPSKSPDRHRPDPLSTKSAEPSPLI